MFVWCSIEQKKAVGRKRCATPSVDRSNGDLAATNEEAADGSPATAESDSRLPIPVGVGVERDASPDAAASAMETDNERSTTADSTAGSVDAPSGTSSCTSEDQSAGHDSLQSGSPNMMEGREGKAIDDSKDESREKGSATGGSLEPGSTHDDDDIRSLNVRASGIENSNTPVTDCVISSDKDTGTTSSLSDTSDGATVEPSAALPEGQNSQSPKIDRAKTDDAALAEETAATSETEAERSDPAAPVETCVPLRSGVQDPSEVDQGSKSATGEVSVAAVNGSGADEPSPLRSTLDSASAARLQDEVDHDAAVIPRTNGSMSIVGEDDSSVAVSVAAAGDVCELNDANEDSNNVEVEVVGSAVQAHTIEPPSMPPTIMAGEEDTLRPSITECSEDTSKRVSSPPTTVWTAEAVMREAAATEETTPTEVVQEEAAPMPESLSHAGNTCRLENQPQVGM